MIYPTILDDIVDMSSSQPMDRMISQPSRNMISLPIEQTTDDRLQQNVASKDAILSSVDSLDNYNELNHAYGIHSFKFSSLGGVLITDLNYTFYIGGDVNVSSINIYDNTTFTDYNVTVLILDSYPGYNGTVNIPGNTGFVTNLSNGTYRFTFSKPGYFSQIYTIDVSGTDTIYQNYTTFQNEYTTIVRNIETKTELTGYNFSLHNVVTGQDENITNAPSSINTFYINSSNYTLTVIKDGYLVYTENLTFVGRENRTEYIDIGFIGKFHFYDEKTLQPFNLSSANSTTLSVICPNSTLYYNITDVNQDINITCFYKKMVFNLFYGTTSYYRTFILSPDDLNNVNIYLIDLTTTQSIYNGIILDDMYGSYMNPRIYVMRNIGNKTEQITADYTDIEGKIGAYLIQNDEYYVYIYSDNNPVRDMGTYTANTAGDKMLKMYTISLSNDLEPKQNGVSYYVFSDNSTGDWNAIGYYNDTAGRTSLLNVLMYDESNIYEEHSAPFYNQTFTNVTAIEIQQNITSEVAAGHSVLVQMNGINNGIPFSSSKYIYNGNSNYDLGLSSYGITGTQVSWFFVILCSCLLMMGTLFTASYVGIFVTIFAMFLAIMGWMPMSLSVLILGLIILILPLIIGGKNR